MLFADVSFEGLPRTLRAYQAGRNVCLSGQ
jgi:hypothetical protein